jgi:hypothetical protein
MLARKKSSRYNIHKFTLNWKIFSFTFNDAEDYATSEKWHKIFISFLVIDPTASGALNVRLRLCGVFAELYVISA